MRARIIGSVLLASVVSAVALVAAPTAGQRRASGWIVYWRENPWPSIWAVRPDGSNDHRIVRNRQNAKRPRLSPDRAWVAFDGTPPGKPAMSDFDIQLVRLDGRGLHTLTRTPDWDTDAQWSPNGKSLSFTRSPPSPHDCTNATIRIVARGGGGGRRVVAGCGARWSPDGTRLVYTSPGGRELRTVDINGGPAHRLLATPEGVQAADWSPDGKKILFIRSHDQSGRDADVYVVNVDGSGVWKLAHGFAGSWSPDGSKILYTPSFFAALFVMNADGSHKRAVIRTLASEPDWR